jgi:hypothetical protein
LLPAGIVAINTTYIIDTARAMLPKPAMKPNTLVIKGLGKVVARIGHGAIETDDKTTK